MADTRTLFSPVQLTCLYVCSVTINVHIHSAAYFDYLAREGVHEQLGASRSFYRLQGEDLQTISTYLSKHQPWLQHSKNISILKCHSEMVLKIRQVTNFNIAASAFSGRYTYSLVVLQCTTKEDLQRGCANQKDCQACRLNSKDAVDHR